MSRIGFFRFLCNVHVRRVLGHNRRELKWDAKANIKFELYKVTHTNIAMPASMWR